MDLMGFLFYIFWVTFYGFFCFKKPIEHPSNWKWTNNQLKQYKDVWSRLRKLYSTSRDMKLTAQSNVMRIKNWPKRWKNPFAPKKDVDDKPWDPPNFGDRYESYHMTAFVTNIFLRQNLRWLNPKDVTEISMMSPTSELSMNH